MVAKGKEAAPPEELRCNRTDGRKWRCSRWVLDGKKLCEIHYLQGQHRQCKRKVPDSLKLERKKRAKSKKSKGVGASNSLENVENGGSGDCKVSKMARKGVVVKRKRGVSEALDEAVKKMKLKRGDLQLELLRVFLKRRVERKKEKAMLENRKEEGKNDEVVEARELELPNALVAVPMENSENVGMKLDVKVGSGTMMQTDFRSKNIEVAPISTMQVAPFADIVKKNRRKCHWCRRSDCQSLIKCLNCKKRFFCMNCVNERSFEKKDIKVRCPVCRGACSCRMCLKVQLKTINHKEFDRDKRKVDKTKQLQYLIYTLLPVLAQINLEHSIEHEYEIKRAGKDDSGIMIQQADTSRKNVSCCSKCHIPVVDYHRSCSSCSYNLCLCCCRELHPGSSPEGLSNTTSIRETYSSVDEQKVKVKQKRSKKASIPSHRESHDTSLSCPRSDYGGCNGRFLELRSIYPVKWTKELEVDAVEMLCDFNFSKTPDNCFCSLCKSLQNETKVELSQEVAKRVDSGDNYLYSPTLHELYKENLDHFQEHWSRGHPVIVRNIFRGTSNLIWDPVVIFCAYLDKCSTAQNSNKETEGTNCLDWFEIEINNKETFMGSLEGQTYANMRRKTIKFNAWLSSSLYQEHFPAHYAETLQALPLQEYMNPTSGLLNLAVKLPGEMMKPELGRIYISYGGPEDFKQAESLTKLCYESCDMVNILAYATDDPISEEQLAKIKSLMKKKPRNSTNQKEMKSMPSEDTGESGLHDVSKDEIQPSNGTTKVPCLSRDSLNGLSTVEDNNSSYDSSETESESYSDASVLSSGSINDSENVEDLLTFFQENEESSSSPKLAAGAKWDIFCRQDVPKLIEYLKRHSDELGSCYSYPKHVNDPILDQTFFLDAFNKLRLEEEYGIQPWSFDQHPGEAIIVPAGCPYQIKKLKSSVSIVLDFISPESANKCIQLNDEIRLLPQRHKAKAKMFEVRKMALHGIDSAIKELRDLTSTKTSSK